MQLRWLFLSVFLFVATNISWAQEATVSNEEAVIPPSADSNEFNPYSGSPHIQTVVAWTHPPYGVYSEKRDINLPAGKKSSLVASLFNVHEGTSLPRFTLDLIEGALHYPGYYDYYIQNFTKIRLQNTLEPSQEGSLVYNFKPAVELSGRPFDLSIVAYYHDENGVYYAHPLFNQTVNLYEVEEGVDTEMLFLVVLVAALGIVLLVGVWHWCSSKAIRRHVPTQVTKVEDFSGDKTVANEYLALIDNKKSTKTERLATELKRRHGKR